MRNVLLIEPDYHSKFPPLGLMRISSFHKERGDTVTFARGTVPWLRQVRWHRVYVSSLFTWELPRTVKTIRYYLGCVDGPANIVVGGIGATLLPDYIRDRAPCTVVVGPLDTPRTVCGERRPISEYVPDYGLLDGFAYPYRPADAYFCRATTGCPRHCRFCAVPLLEPRFGRTTSLARQIAEVNKRFGERQHLVLLDNNVLALKEFPRIAAAIRDLGFETGSKRQGRQRTVDFNQGLDARFITPATAKLLAAIALSPARLAFDFDAVEPVYRSAVRHLASAGLREFTTYVLFNFNDTPESLYRRLRVNFELGEECGAAITAFPMRFVPMDDIDRRYVAPGWKWRYLRGFQCILNATRGLVSPHRVFFDVAFGKTCEEFLEILAMPDHYISYRDYYRSQGVADWKRAYRRLSTSARDEFLNLLEVLNKAKDRRERIERLKRFGSLIEHYYQGGRTLRGVPPSQTQTDISLSLSGSPTALQAAK